MGKSFSWVIVVVSTVILGYQCNKLISDLCTTMKVDGCGIAFLMPYHLLAVSV